MGRIEEEEVLYLTTTGRPSGPPREIEICFTQVDALVPRHRRARRAGPVGTKHPGGTAGSGAGRGGGLCGRGPGGGCGGGARRPCRGGGPIAPEARLGRRPLYLAGPGRWLEARVMPRPLGAKRPS